MNIDNLAAGCWKGKAKNNGDYLRNGKVAYLSANCSCVTVVQRASVFSYNISLSTLWSCLSCTLSILLAIHIHINLQLFCVSTVGSLCFLSNTCNPALCIYPATWANIGSRLLYSPMGPTADWLHFSDDIKVTLWLIISLISFLGHFQVGLSLLFSYNFWNNRQYWE